MNRKSLSVLFIVCTLVSSVSHAINLEQAYHAAVSRSETVGHEQARLTQSQEQINQARGAVLPKLALNASYGLQDQPSDPLARQFSPRERPEVSLSATQPLFRGFREFAALRQRKNLSEAQKLRVDQAGRELFREVAQSFYTVVSLEQDVANLKEQLSLYNERLSDLKGRVRTGQSNTTEQLTAESARAALQAETQLVEGQLNVAREVFASLTGLDRDSTLDGPNGAELKRGPQPKTLSEYLAHLDERPDVKSANFGLAAADEQIKLARGGHLPTVDVQGNYYLKRPSGFLDEVKWDVAIRLTLPLYEGGVTQSQVREAGALRTEAALEKARARRLAEQDIRTLFQSLKANLDQISALEKSTELASRNYSVLRRDYPRGLARNLDVLQALTDMRVGRRRLDQARYNAQLDFIRLQIAAGSPLP